MSENPLIPDPAETGSLEPTPVRQRRRPPSGPPQREPAFADLKLVISYVPLASLVEARRLARTHSKRQVEQIAASIGAFGFLVPVLINADREIVAGHARLAAARHLGMSEVPVISVDHLDEAGYRALRIAENRLAELAGWDRDLLALEFKELHELELTLDLSFDSSITGFETPAIDILIDSVSAGDASADEQVPELDEQSAPVSRLGDLWLLGDHRLICGDSREPAVYARLLGNERASLGIHDAPYDVSIKKVVSPSGRHGEFLMGSGELGAAFTPFLADFLKASTAVLKPGGYQFAFMDWRHMREMLDAGAAADLEFKNLCVWNKGSGAMGSLYRSQHELIFVFKEKSAPGLNNVMLGKFGRNRTNVFDYPGAASLRKELELHPTPKPVALVADVIRDVTTRGDIVLDAFSGSGSTLIAAAKTGRRGRAIELDPRYVDVGVKRWQEWSGKEARHAETGLTFAETAALREAEAAKANDNPSTPSGVRQRVRRAA